MWWLLAPFRYLVIAPLRLLNSIFRMLVIIIAIAGAFFIGAHFASASTTIHYTCAEFTIFGGGGSCGSDVVSLPFGGYAYSNQLQFPPGTVVYISFIPTGVDSGIAYFGGDGTDGAPTVNFTAGTPVVNEMQTVGDGTVRNALVVVSSAAFIGDISDICVSDDPFGCGGGPTPSAVGGSILPSIFTLISVFLSFLVLIRFAKPTERFIAGLSPSKFVQRLFGRTLRGRKRWYE